MIIMTVLLYYYLFLIKQVFG